jgi:hypothetical protein
MSSLWASDGCTWTEPLCHIEELQQQREATEMSGMSAQQPLMRLIKQLSDSLALQRSISDNAGMFVAVAQNPRLANGVIAREWSGENSAQTSATPKPILEDRFESQRIERYIFHQSFSGVIPRFERTLFGS